ncbi:MAG TPA: ribonuclease P protein component [bacterium]|jgi:ribonuclease P protein component|nr:ribonuclease P protein component [bacterium]
MFAKENRLRRKKDIDMVFRKGEVASSGSFFVKYAPGRDNVSRFTVIVGTKSGLKAVGRNLLKRRIRAILQDAKIGRKKTIFLVAGVRGRFVKVPKFAEIKSHISQCLEKLRLL